MWIEGAYLHSDIDAIERVEILRGLRAAEFDILVGINLLREGSIYPRFRWCAFWTRTRKDFCAARLRSSRQPAARRATSTAKWCSSPTRSRKAWKLSFDFRIPARQADGVQRNARHHAANRPARRPGKSAYNFRGREVESSVIRETGGDFNLSELLRELEQEMQEASANLEFERAALLRDQIMEVKTRHGSNEN
jgi:Helicase subunit of the DNA excision repair complex